MKKLTVGARMAWRIAAIETKTARQQYIEKEQILIGICSLKKMIDLQKKNEKLGVQDQDKLITERRSIEKILKDNNIDTTQFRRQLRRLIAKGNFTHSDSVIHRSETCKKFFTRADTLAERSKKISGLHLLAAILEKPGDLVNQLLENFHIEPADLREQALRQADQVHMLELERENRDLLQQQRSDRFQKIIRKYQIISLEDMAQFLLFDNPIDLQKWLMDVFEDSPLKIKRNEVLIHSTGSSEEVEAEIDQLLEKYREWEDKKYGKK